MIGRAFILGMMVSTAGAQQPTSNLLLANQYGELCTMCVGTLSCAAPEGAATTFVFQKKTFLGQMMTVLDFIPGIGKGAWESRPVVITPPDTGPRTETARLSIKEAKIEAGGTVIDRASGAWMNDKGAALGTCVWTDKTAGAK
jgi:hypothetical protein